ncbi:HupE/UreJ family protein [Paenibacillus spongiae]|uniref:HupE/UreJ family protein n=1 Tax=Paenibacillus spongiae TaxID=2909671 RepID=A0ABY5S6N2_9BACL|nr:HupE/UreJ family protein [Paenibacillus spongiae]UVI29374.1 HupE/UreJ family protein [Paenibacillus spongiae]
MIRRSFLLFIILLSIGTATTSFADVADLGYSKLYIQGNEIDYELFIEQDLLGQFDTNKDDNLDNEELASQKDKIDSYIKNGLRIDIDSNPLKMELLSMNVIENSSGKGAVIGLRFTADEEVEQFDLHYNLVFDDAPNHTSLLLVNYGEYSRQEMLATDKRDIHINVPRENVGVVLWRYFVLGIEHLLTGYDHVLFLLSLIIITSSFKEALKIVTAFTVAHSITLFLVASGRIQVISSWVEAIIALSICYVAVENIFVQKAKWRWILTAIFGLIHGMGFAGALAETGLPKSNLIGTLLMFNLGVEVGQLIIICLLLPLLIWMRKFPWYRKMMISTSCLIFVLAFYWLIQRL